MQRKLLYFLIAMLALPATAFAITVPWNRVQVGTQTPLYTIDGILVTASSTIGSGSTTGGLTVNGTATTTNFILFSAIGNAGCATLSALGLLSSTGSACGSGSGGSGTVSTSTNETAGQLSYWTSNSATPALLGQVATGTLSSGTGLTGNATRSVVGGALTIDCDISDTNTTGCLSDTDWDTFNNKQATIGVTWPITLSGATVGFNGLSTSSAAVVGNIPYFSGVNTFANVATTSVTCTGDATCDPFTVIGASPITISASGGSGGSGSVSTSSNEVANQVAYFTSNSATPALIGGSPNFTFDGTDVGIGTTSPFAKLSVHAQAGETSKTLFAIGSSTASATTTLFQVLNNGGVVMTNNLGFTPDNTYSIGSCPPGISGNCRLSTITAVGNITSTGGVVSGASVYASSVFRFTNAGTQISESGIGLLYAGNGGATTFTALKFNGTNAAWPLLGVKARTLYVGLGSGADGGSFGVGTSSPFAQFAIHAPAGQATTTLFAIASSTASATTTLFSVRNTGAVFATALTSATGGTNNAVCINATTGELINESTGACVVSSERYKHDITTLTTPALPFLLDLRPVSFAPNDDDMYDYEDQQIGFIAEEVAKIDPHLAKYGEDGLPRTLDDRALLALTVKAVQELAQREIGSVTRSAEENWQNILIGLLFLGLLYQGVQIRRIKKQL